MSFGKPGASHDHTFVDIRTTNAWSTFGSLRSGWTSCTRADDTAAYWIPTRYQGTTAVLPAAATIYYRRATFATVKTFPRNLRMIAGDAAAMTPQPFRVVFWDCRGGEVGRRPQPCRLAPTSPVRRSASTCASRAAGTAGGSTAPTTRATWPTPFGVCAPRATRSPCRRSRSSFAIRAWGGSGFSLASGGQLSGHADFLNAWKPSALRKLVEDCLNELVRCGRG